MGKTLAVMEMIDGVEGPCLAIGKEYGSRRFVGPKPWGGGCTVREWKMDERALRELRAEIDKLLPNPKEDGDG